MKITLINDLSGFGNCSLCAAIPALAALGHETHPFPTAILSNQTAYDSYFMADCTRYFDDFLREWRKNGEKTDCVYLGFTPSKALPEKAAALAEEYDAKFLFDPVLGDDGKLYKCFDESFVARYAAVVPRADYLTPNLTECCLLCGESYADVLSADGENALIEKVFSLAEKLRAAGAKNVVVTGVKSGGRLFNACAFESGRHLSESRCLERSYSGTGDLFASVFLGYVLNGERCESAADKAGAFVSACIERSIQREIAGVHGVDFAPLLKNL